MALLRPGALLLDMGSSDPRRRCGWRRCCARPDWRWSTRRSGAVAAAAGTLAIMAGGDAADLERASAAVAHGRHADPTGAVGSAHAMKALNNYVYAAGLLAASEALLIARRMGLDLDVFTDVLNASSGRNVATETKLRQFIVPGSYAGGFALALMARTCVPPMRCRRTPACASGSCRCAPGCGSARWRRWSRAWTTRGSTNTWSG